MSTVMLRGALGALSLPEGSVSVYVMECAPSPRGVVGVSVPETGS